MRAKSAPVERFPKVGGRVQLRYGDLAFLEEQLGRSRSHIARVIERVRESADLRQQIERLVGAPIDCIDLPRKGSKVVA